MPGEAFTEVREHAKRQGTNVSEQRHSSAGRAAHRGHTTANAPAARPATGGFPAAHAQRRPGPQHGSRNLRPVSPFLGTKEQWVPPTRLEQGSASDSFPGGRGSPGGEERPPASGPHPRPPGTGSRRPPPPGPTSGQGPSPRGRRPSRRAPHTSLPEPDSGTPAPRWSRANGRALPPARVPPAAAHAAPTTLPRRPRSGPATPPRRPGGGRTNFAVYPSAPRATGMGN